MISKRGVSPVIATVLVLMITIVAAALIAPFAINFVSNNLDESGSCFDVLGDLTFTETDYNCNSNSGGNDGTGFSVRIDNENIVGFKVLLFSSGSADSVEILDGSTSNMVRMRGSDFNTSLEVPTKGGVRTYVADGIFDRIEIGPILENGRSCEISDVIEPNSCTDSDVITDVTEF